jgi:tetratricopeptide (TPR) repeat protein
MQIHKSFLIFLIIVACALSYWNSLSGQFVWDDNTLIVDNVYMQSFRFLPEFFTHDIWSVGMKKIVSGYYRPLLAASFMLDYSLWQKNPFGYHLGNILLHILASILVFLLTEKLAAKTRLAFFAALLFATHPLHTETVSFISGRVDSLPLIFFLLSLLLFLRYASVKKLPLCPVRKDISNGTKLPNGVYLLSLFCFFMSLLGKEVAIVLPLVVACIDYFFISKFKLASVVKNFSRFYLGFIITTGVYLALRSYFVGWSFLELNARYVSNFLPETPSYWRFFTVLKIYFLYIRLLFFPYGLKADYYLTTPNSFWQPSVLLGAFLVLLFAGIAVKIRRRQPLLSFSIAWFFITSLPASNIFPIGNIFAERYMYIPSVGFCMAIGFFFSWLLEQKMYTRYLNWKVSVYIIFFLLIAALGSVAFARNKVWNNEFSLWYETARATPSSLRAHINLANVYYKLNLVDKAKEEIKKVFKLAPNHHEGLALLGQIYAHSGSLDRAIKLYTMAIKERPDKLQVYNNLGIAYARQGHYKEAIEALLVALKHNPYFFGARYNLALTYANAGLIDEAVRVYEEYLAVVSKDAAAHFEVGNLYYKKNNCTKAKLHWRAALKASRDYAPALYALSHAECK